MAYGCGGTTRAADADAGASGRAGGGAGGAGSAGAGAGSAGMSGAGAGGLAAGGSAEQAPLLIDGVPVGDCREPTSATRLPGCPERPPGEGFACEAPNGVKQCPYDIEVREGEAWQRVFVCHPEQLTWSSSQFQCGVVCPDLAPHVLELERNCEGRTITKCANPDIVYAFETAQQLLDSALERALRSCWGDMSYGTRFRIEVEQGCATRFESAVALPPAVASCVTGRLNGLRWDCASNLRCGRYYVAILL